ncbi:MAG: AEC family transporter [Lachnospiraceae bacterium]|nr:AEC family transporter [Lachnospiraceae bacterium]
MDNFIYSLNATMPVFLVMVLGYFLRRINVINDNFAKVSDKLVFQCALPVYVFHDIATCNLTEDLSPGFALFCAGSTVVFFLVIWGLAELFIKDKKEIGSFVQGSFRGSAAVLGIAFAENIYGDAGMVPAMIVASIPLFNIFSVIVLCRSDAGMLTSRASMRYSRILDVLKGIVTNPIIIGIVAGIPFALLHATFPPIVEKTLNSVGALSTPLALISIGAGFQGVEALSRIGYTVWAALIKLVFMPAVFLPLAVCMGFRGAHLIAIMILVGAPSTVSGYIMAKNMNNDYVLSSSIVMVTTLLSSVTITLTVYLLKAFSYI